MKKKTTKKIISAMAILAMLWMLACSKKDDPKPSLETPREEKPADNISAEQKRDVQAASQTAAKAADARQTAANASEKVNSVKGSRLAALRRAAREGQDPEPLPPYPNEDDWFLDTTGFGWDTTGFDFDTTSFNIDLADIFTDSVLADLESELAQEMGGTVRFAFSNNKMTMEIDYGGGSPNPAWQQGLRIPKTFKGKLSFEFAFNLTATGVNEEDSDTDIRFTNYEEIYDNAFSGLNTKIDGTMNNKDRFIATGYNSISSMDIDFTDSSGTVGLKGVATIAGQGHKTIENSTYDITIGSETFKFTSVGVEYDATCTKSLGNPIKGTATILFKIDGADVTAVIDYGDGKCDAQATIKVGEADPEDFPLDDNTDASNEMD